MEQYIIIAKETTKGKFEDYRIVKSESSIPIPEGFTQIFGPASLDDSQKYFKEVIGTNTNWFGLTVAQYALIFAVTLAFVWVIIQGAGRLQWFNVDNSIKIINSADDAARILITFLVAVATVAIAFLAILTAMVIREYKERFALAKEVLTVLIGILGTIVGFYFGTAKSTGINTNSNTNGNSSNTNSSNANTNSNPDTNTNSNTSAHILRLPSGRERYVAFVSKKKGVQRIFLQ